MFGYGVTRNGTIQSYTMIGPHRTAKRCATEQNDNGIVHGSRIHITIYGDMPRATMTISKTFQPLRQNPVGLIHIFVLRFLEANLPALAFILVEFVSHG